jgi:DNA-binding transcriptional LysR family regulator
MNTDHIKIFLAVYRAGSFVTVAKDRNVAPSSITRSVACLEAALKARLFHRSTRSVKPTEAGDLYFRQMASLMEGFDQAHELLAERGEGPSGRLRVSASVSYGQIVIAPQIKRFRDLFPKIELELILTDNRIDLISEQIDVAIRHGRLPDSGLTARKLTDVSYSLVASPHYLAIRPAVQHPKDLTAHELVAFSYSDFRSQWNFKKAEADFSLAITPTLIISNAAAICRCVSDGAGVALLADWTIERDLREKRLVKVLADWHVGATTQEANIWLVYPSSRFVPAPTRVFADFMQDIVRRT